VILFSAQVGGNKHIGIIIGGYGIGGIGIGIGTEGS